MQLFCKYHSTYNSLVLIFTIFWLNWWACFIRPRDSKVSGSSLSFRMASGTKNCNNNDKKIDKCFQNSWFMSTYKHKTFCQFYKRMIFFFITVVFLPDRLQPVVCNCHVCFFLQVHPSHYLSKVWLIKIIMRFHYTKSVNS